jgi:imidazole glycerol-phosphate synthase subunit HisH
VRQGSTAREDAAIDEGAAVSIALVDYGAGNLTSVVKALGAVGADIRVVRDAASLDAVEAVVVPGVGHFAATASLGPAWRTAVLGAIDRGIPMLGICLGLQWLFDGSAEAPDVPGLGVLPGRCFRLDGDVKVPHVGWNTLDRTARPSRLLAGLPANASAYFTHSYAAPVVAETVATTTHAVPFSAVVERDRMFGVQFHPEKSGATGLAVLTNFLRIVGEVR